MTEFVKLYGSILYSTVWLETLPTKVVWITMLALADWEGLVAASVPGLAKIAGVTREDCEAAIATLSGPDPDSKTKEFEGRRILEVDGGWKIINHGKYRDMRTETQVKTAQRVKQHRDKVKALRVTDVTRRNTKKRTVTPVTPDKDKDKETDTTTTNTSAPSESDVTGNNGQHSVSWPVEGAELWGEAVGPITPPRFGRSLKPVVLKYGWPETKAALLTYIELNEGKTRKVEWFAGDVVRWVALAKMPCVDPETRELTEKGRMAYSG